MAWRPLTNVLSLSFLDSDSHSHGARSDSLPISAGEPLDPSVTRACPPLGVLRVVRQHSRGLGMGVASGRQPGAPQL